MASNETRPPELPSGDLVPHPARTASFGERLLQTLARLVRRPATQPPAPVAEDDWYEALAVQALRERGTVRLDVLANDVAERAMRDDLLRGGLEVDTALWGPAIYRRHAAHALQRMIGRALVLECEGPWALAVMVAPPGGGPAEQDTTGQAAA